MTVQPSWIREEAEVAPPLHSGLHLRILSWLTSTPMGQALLIVAAWRLLIGIAGIAGYFALGTGPNPIIREQGWPLNPLTIALATGIRGDAYWYATIAQHGYSYSPTHTSSIGWYPLYPLLIRSVGVLTGNVYVAGMLMSTICLFLAVMLFVTWLDDRGYVSKAPLATAAMLAFPAAFFYVAMLSESIYLLLVLAAFVCYERRLYPPAAVCLFLCVLTRPTGIVLLPCLALLWWSTRGRSVWDLLTLVAGVAAALVFSGYQYWEFGTPLAYIRAQALPPNYRTLSQGTSDMLLHGHPGMPSWYLALMLGVAVLFLVTVPVVYRRFGTAYALFVGISIVLPASTGLLGLDRYVIVAFPVFAALAVSWKKEVLTGLAALGFCAGPVFAALFAGGLTV